MVNVIIERILIMGQEKLFFLSLTILCVSVLILYFWLKPEIKTEINFFEESHQTKFLEKLYGLPLVVVLFSFLFGAAGTVLNINYIINMFR